MQIRMEDRNQPLVPSPTIAIERFQQDTIARSIEWAKELQNKPDDFPTSNKRSIRIFAKVPDN